jgi:hypothetical protein
MSVTINEKSLAAARDEKLFKAALTNLKEKGSVEYEGEFGAEIATFIPFVAWLKKEGLLEGRQVITYDGMRPYYFFLSDDEYQSRSESRRYVPAQKRKWPSNSTYTATRQRWHAPPDYRLHFSGRGSTFDRPVLFIQNKFIVEWNIGPINYLPLAAIEQLFRLAANRFHVVYSRPRDSINGRGFVGDHNTNCEYPDLDLARRYPDVEILEETCLQSGADYNTTKLEILAKSHLFVAVQGGGTHLLACFNNSFLLLLDRELNGVITRENQEYPHAYVAGPYKYLSTPPPILLVARNNDQFVQGMKILDRASVKEGSPVFDPKVMPQVAAMRM